MKSSALIFVVALLSFSWIIGYVLAIEQLDTSIPVPGGDGVNQFLFDLGNSQMVELDVINPAIDFSFRLIFNGVSGNHSEAEALKDTPIALFTFIVENEATVPGIDFGAAIRLIYNDALFSVDPSTLSWYEFRSDRWREFPDPSTLSALTKTVTQGFQRDALRPGETYLGVYGGNRVKFPDDDYDFDLYDRYDVVHPISKTVSNKFSFALPGKNEAFELEVLGADRDYSIILSRPTENPFPSASFPSGTDTPVYFFTLAIQNNARPTYNIVFRYKYKTLPVSVDPTTLQFAYYKGSSFSKFALEGSKNELSGIVTQGASSIDDSMPVTTNLVIVGQKSSAVPSPSPSTTSPTPSSKPPTAGSSPKQSTDPRESSKKNHSDNIHFNLVLMVLAMSLFALAHHIF